MKAGYKNIPLRDDDVKDLIDTANSLATPIGLGLDLNAPQAIRILVRLTKGWNIEQARKYNEAIEQWKKEEEQQ